VDVTGLSPPYDITRRALHLHSSLFKTPNSDLIKENTRQTQTEGHSTKYLTSIPLKTVKVTKNKKRFRNCHRSKEIEGHMRANGLDPGTEKGHI